MLGRTPGEQVAGTKYDGVCHELNRRESELAISVQPRTLGAGGLRLLGRGLALGLDLLEGFVVAAAAWTWIRSQGRDRMGRDVPQV